MRESAGRGALLLAVLLLILLFFKSALLRQGAFFISSDKTINEDVNRKSRDLYVIIYGAVKKPGKYTMPPASRLKHLLLKAGGLKPNVNLRLIDLNAPLFDKQKIYIPARGELPDTVDVNIASRFWLMRVRGIGPVKASAISKYRNKFGAFLTLDDLRRVKGIGPKTVAKLKNKLRIIRYGD